MNLNPYLTFDGHCAEAMAFHQSVLGGDLTVMRYGDMPSDEPVPDGLADKVAHAGLDLGSVRLQASDMMGPGESEYTGFDLQVEPGDAETGRALFDRLAEGGRVVVPFAPTFWSKGFGRCHDRFGVPWMVNCE